MIGGVSQRISSPVVVGRAAELARLGAGLERAATGVPVAVVVAGEAGVGKTRLVTEFAGRAGSAGAVVLAGGCLDVGDGTLPYAPVAEALRSLTAVLDPAELDAVLGSARGELARLVPELGEPDPEPVVPAPARLFGLLLGVIHRLAERGPVLVVVEDLHWADRSTRDLLGFLVRNLRAGVLLVLTYRTDELHRRHPLRPFLAELERGGRAERLELGRLTRRELIDLIAGILGHRPTSRLVADILARSQGNPFFAEELLAAHPDRVELPSALRDVLLARVESLSEDAQWVLRVAAVAGSRVDHHLLAAVAAVSEQRLLELLREAVGQFLVVVDRSGAYAFRHALVQEVLYEELLPGERSGLHAAYARALTARPAGHERLGELGQLAHHWYAAHDAGAALLASVQAGLAAEAAYALAEAEGHYGRALELWAQAPEAAARSPLDRPSLLQRAAEAAQLTGETDRAVALAGQALAAVDRAAEPLRAGVLLERLGRYHWLRVDSEAAATALEEAVALVPASPPTPERARVLAAHGQLLMLQGRNAEAAARCEQAIGVARQIGAKDVEGRALTSFGTALAQLGQVDEGIARLRAARDIAEKLGNPEDVGRVEYNLTGVLLNAGRAEASLAMALKARQAAARLGSVQVYGAGAIAHAAEVLVLLGRWAEAERLLTDEMDLELPTQGIHTIVAHGLLARGRLRLWQGDTAAARADLTNVLVRGRKGLEPHGASPLFALLTRVATWEGRLAEARSTAAQGLTLLAGSDDAYLVIEVCLAGMEAEATRAELARARRSPEQLTETRQVARQLLGRSRAVAGGRRLGGPTAAGLATIDAEWSRIHGPSDPARWAAAAAAWDALSFPFPAALARLREAEALLAAGAPRTQASPVLRQAAAVASQLGAGWLHRETTALARRARIDLDPSTEPAPAAPLPDHELGLTPREHEVLTLVADGRTNRQIAETLYITDKTVGVHVTHILAKLQVTNRGEAAAIAHRLGLTNDQAPGKKGSPQVPDSDS
jgi:predicted ATPase/DNA-binding CsgD family transcriptional regulator